MRSLLRFSATGHTVTKVLLAMGAMLIESGAAADNTLSNQALYAETANAYTGAFSREEEVDPGAKDSKKDALALEGSEAPVVVTLQSSFPIRLHIGTTSKDWSQIPADAGGPKPLVKKFQADKCIFELRSGAFSLTTHKRAEANDFTVDRDAVLADTLFSMEPGESMYLTFATDVQVEISPAFKQACTSKFSGRRVFLGKMGFSAGAISLIGAKQPASVTEVQPGQTRKVYLNWQSSARGPIIEDEAAYPALLESPLYAVKSSESGGFFMTTKPSWDLEKKLGTKETPLK